MNSKKIHVKLDEDHGGCWNATAVRFKDGGDFELSSPTNWIELRYVDYEKAYFSKEANEITKQKSYVIKGNILVVTEKKDGWVKCEFRGKKTVTGWIKENLLNKL